jgi:hypothetical protein
MENWTGEQFLQLQESGIQPQQFSVCLDPGGGTWRTLVFLLSPQNGGHHGGAAEYPCHRRPRWEKPKGGCGLPVQYAKLTRQTWMWQWRQYSPLAVGMMQTILPWRTDLPTGDEQKENRSLE